MDSSIPKTHGETCAGYFEVFSEERGTGGTGEIWETMGRWGNLLTNTFRSQSYSILEKTAVPLISGCPGVTLQSGPLLRGTNYNVQRDR